jgi:hypothetical protein
MFCPHCKSTHVETTCLALQNGEDINECVCHKCKRRGIVRDWVLLCASQSKIDGASANTAGLPCPVFRGDPDCECEMGFQHYCNVTQPCKLSRCVDL